MNSVLLLLLLAKFAASFSGCQICASAGQCNAAFRNGVGKYCGSFYDISISDNKPCCCPPQAACRVTPTQCMCHVSNRPPPPPPQINYAPSYDHAVRPGPPRDEYREATSSWGAWPLLFVLVLCGCGICYYRGNDDRVVLSSEHVPVAKAVPASYCPSSENPALRPGNYQDYGSNAMYGNPSGGGGGVGVGTAIASGLGGLAAGTLIGNLIGQNHAPASETPQFGGGYGGYEAAGGDGGGYDIAGDDGGYDGGGYDVAGDDGGGFDVGGDDGGE